MSTSTLATTTTETVVKIPLKVMVSSMYVEARDLVLGDPDVIRLPRLTEAGLERVRAELGSREPRGFAAYICTIWAWGNDLKKFPAANRRRKLLTAMAGWLPGVSMRMEKPERWFSVGAVRGLARDCRSTPEEAAGFIGLQLARMCPAPA